MMFWYIREECRISESENPLFGTETTCGTRGVSWQFLASERTGGRSPLQGSDTRRKGKLRCGNPERPGKAECPEPVAMTAYHTPDHQTAAHF